MLKYDIVTLWIAGFTNEGYMTDPRMSPSPPLYKVMWTALRSRPWDSSDEDTMWYIMVIVNCTEFWDGKKATSISSSRTKCTFNLHSIWPLVYFCSPTSPLASQVNNSPWPKYLRPYFHEPNPFLTLTLIWHLTLNLALFHGSLNYHSHPCYN